MTALMLSWEHLSRMAMASRFCSSVDCPGLLGQSMLPTLATQTPRNSRGAGGGVASAPDGCALGPLLQPVEIRHMIITHRIEERIGTFPQGGSGISTHAHRIL